MVSLNMGITIRETRVCCVALTGGRKSGTFKIPIMSKTTPAAAAFVLTGLLLALGCAAHRPGDQIRFGIWAAGHDLWDEAIFRWKKVLSQDPGSAAAHNNLAVAYEKKGLWEEARKEYEAALKLAPENAWVKLNFRKFKENLEPGKAAREEKKPQDEKK
jgi:tetratricopeptide (TPR) repeat protein